MKEKTENKWQWAEPSNEEFDKRRMEETFYRIYKVGKDGINETLFKFWAKNDDEALAMLHKWQNEHPEEKEGTYYSTSGYYCGPDGKRFDTFRDSLELGKESWWSKAYGFFRYVIPRKLGDFKFKFKDTWHFFKTGHSLTESWNLDSHIIQDIIFNLKKMAENPTGCPEFMCERARKKLGKDNSPENNDTETMNLAMEMWKDELKRLRTDALLYKYYTDFGISDGDKDLLEIESEYKDTLPYKPGTNKEFDYVRLRALAQERWNAVWDWIKEYGEALWD